MLEFVQIKIEEFENEIYDEYITLFPEDEQRDWGKIKKTYENGQEKFYKIISKQKVVGFFMLEKCSDAHPYYIDYFAIFKEYQNKGFGTEAIKKILREIASEEGICIEIEKMDENNPNTLRRAKFYENLGFEKIESEYLLYDVYYVPYVYMPEKMTFKENIDRIMFDYYLMNCGEKQVRERCKIIR